MKRFTLLFSILIVGALALRAFFQASPASSLVTKAENNPTVLYSNALELQYAQPWLEAQNKPVVAYGNALELQYAQPWLPETKLTISVTGSKTPLDCSSSLEMLYACKYGYARP